MGWGVQLMNQMLTNIISCDDLKCNLYLMNNRLKMKTFNRANVELSLRCTKEGDIL